MTLLLMPFSLSGHVIRTLNLHVLTGDPVVLGQTHAVVPLQKQEVVVLFRMNIFSALSQPTGLPSLSAHV
jgi:hypothetical protein